MVQRILLREISDCADRDRRGGRILGNNEVSWGFVVSNILSSYISFKNYISCYSPCLSAAYRWYAVGDASFLEATLSHIGFFSLLVIAVFEVDVSSESFLEQKVLITSWFLEILDVEKHLDFSPHVHNPKLLDFIRESNDILHLYEEDDGKMKLESAFFSLKKIQFSLHVVGAMSYSVFVTAAIILNEINEEKVAWITGVSFLLFSALGYLSGAYVPIFRMFRGWVLLWNPFMREPEFLEKLQQVILPLRSCGRMNYIVGAPGC